MYHTMRFFFVFQMSASMTCPEKFPSKLYQAAEAEWSVQEDGFNIPFSLPFPRPIFPSPSVPQTKLSCFFFLLKEETVKKRNLRRSDGSDADLMVCRASPCRSLSSKRCCLFDGSLWYFHFKFHDFCCHFYWYAFGICNLGLVPMTSSSTERRCVEWDGESHTEKGKRRKKPTNSCTWIRMCWGILRGYWCLIWDGGLRRPHHISLCQTFHTPAKCDAMLCQRCSKRLHCSFVTKLDVSRCARLMRKRRTVTRRRPWHF